MWRLAAGGIGLLLLAGGYLAVMFLAQRAVLFPAPRVPAETSRPTAERVLLDQPDGAVEAFFLAPTASGQTGPAPLIIFTHGNAELAEYWIDEFAEPRTWGWAVLLLEYPGYGRSAGRPSEQSIIGAARAAHDWASRDPRIDPHRVVAYGRSLGGSPAARLAADRGLAGVILESAFTSVRPLAWRFLIPAMLVRDPLDTLAALSRYTGPTLVLHGRDDDVIPVAHGRALAAAVSGAEFRELACRHNDCPRPWQLVSRFLFANGLMAPPDDQSRR